MWKHIRIAGMISAAIAAPVGWLATNSVPQTIKDADGYIATNLKWIGWKHPPKAIATTSADHFVLAVCTVFFVLGLLAALSWGLEKRRAKKRPQQNESPPHEGAPALFDIAGDLTDSTFEDNEATLPSSGRFLRLGGSGKSVTFKGNRTRSADQDK